MEKCQLDSSGSGYGQPAGCYERGNEPSGYLPVGEFLDWPIYCRLLKKQLVTGLEFEPVLSLTNAFFCIMPPRSLADLVLQQVAHRDVFCLNTEHSMT